MLSKGTCAVCPCVSTAPEMQPFMRNSTRQVLVPRGSCAACMQWLGCADHPFLSFTLSGFSFPKCSRRESRPSVPWRRLKLEGARLQRPRCAKATACCQANWLPRSSSALGMARGNRTCWAKTFRVLKLFHTNFILLDFDFGSVRGKCQEIYWEKASRNIFSLAPVTKKMCFVMYFSGVTVNSLLVSRLAFCCAFGWSVWREGWMDG